MPQAFYRLFSPAIHRKSAVTRASARLLVLFMATLPICASADAPSFESQGVYIKEGESYTAAKPIAGVQSLSYDFGRYLMVLPQVKNLGKELEVIVFKDDYTPDWADVQLRAAESPGAGRKLAPTGVKKLGEDTYQLNFELPATNAHFVLIDVGCCTNNVFGVALTDMKKAVLAAFKEESLNPVSAEYTLAGIVKGAPEDKELTALYHHWQKKIQQKEASEQFGSIVAAWKNYESTERADKKNDNLESVKAFSENYLAHYPDGDDAAKVIDYLNKANKKLGN